MDDADAELEVASPPWKALKASALGGVKRKSDADVNRYSSVAAPYGPADPVASTYFQVVISKAKAPIVCGDAGPVKGKAIYAERDLPKATRIWTESPLVAMQHENNRSVLPCCQFCYLPLLADAQRQWQDIVGRYNAQTQTTAQKDKATTTAVDAGALDKALQVLHITPRTCGMAGAGARCVCGELYCSKLCQMRAFHEYHAILCPRNDPCSAMGEFLEHTRHTNDIFLLAAKVIARVLSRYLVWRDIVKAREPIDMFYKKPWWEVVVVEHDELEETSGQTTVSGSDETNSDGGGSTSSSTSGTSPSGGSGKEQKASGKTPAQKRQQGADNEQKQEVEPEVEWIPNAAAAGSKAQCLQEVLTLTHQLLVDALECNLVRLEREGQLRGVTVEEIWRCCSSVLSFEFFTAQIGLFEMNNISMEVDHPFHAFVDILDPDVQSDLAAGDADHSDGQSASRSPRFQPQLTAEDQALLASVRRVLEWEEERLRTVQAEQRLEGKPSDEAAFDPLMPLGFPSIEGTSLFPIICTMNHSCDPNCTVMYTKNGDGHVVAIRDIKKGEELCICYIDVDMDVQTREANLREYKFKCLCTRCVEERQLLDRQAAPKSGLPRHAEQDTQPKKKAKRTSPRSRR